MSHQLLRSDGQQHRQMGDYEAKRDGAADRRNGVVGARKRNMQGNLGQKYCISRFEQRDKILFLIGTVAPWLLKQGHRHKLRALVRENVKTCENL